jgi:uncharacterized protein YbjT (DUF2867 family)
MSKIVIFGARGNIGSHLVNTLYGEGGIELRLISSHDEGVQSLSSEYPSAEVVKADLSDEQSLINAIQGASRVFVMYPDFELDEEASTIALINAVRENGNIQQVVRLLGVVSLVREEDIPQSFRETPSMPCWVHWRGRELWQESGLPVTFINPWSWYMQSLPWLVGKGIVEEDTFCLPFSHTLPYIDTRDISEVAAKILTQDVSLHVGKELCLTGHQDDCFSFSDLANFMSENLGRDIFYSGSLAKFEYLMGAEGAAPLVKYIGWEKSVVDEYRAHTDVVESILGRQPRRFKDWIAENKSLFAPLA